MLRKSVAHCVLLSLFCCVPIFGLSGCSQDTTPVQTSENDIEQFLAENPEENYSSDGVGDAEADEMEADEQDDDLGDEQVNE